MLMGNYKEYVAAKKAYSSVAIENFELCKKAPAMNYKVPIFSKAGFNIMKCSFFDLFRKKTPQEKQFKKLAYGDKLKINA